MKQLVTAQPVEGLCLSRATMPDDDGGEWLVELGKGPWVLNQESPLYPEQSVFVDNLFTCTLTLELAAVYADILSSQGQIPDELGQVDAELQVARTGGRPDYHFLYDFLLKYQDQVVIHGGGLLIVGKPGVGKSHLLKKLRQRSPRTTAVIEDDAYKALFGIEDQLMVNLTASDMEKRWRSSDTSILPVHLLSDFEQLVYQDLELAGDMGMPTNFERLVLYILQTIRRLIGLYVDYYYDLASHQVEIVAVGDFIQLFANTLAAAGITTIPEHIIGFLKLLPFQFSSTIQLSPSEARLRMYEDYADRRGINDLKREILRPVYKLIDDIYVGLADRGITKVIASPHTIGAWPEGTSRFDVERGGSYAYLEGLLGTTPVSVGNADFYNIEQTLSNFRVDADTLMKIWYAGEYKPSSFRHLDRPLWHSYRNYLMIAYNYIMFVLAIHILNNADGILRAAEDSFAEGLLDISVLEAIRDMAQLDSLEQVYGYLNKEFGRFKVVKVLEIKRIWEFAMSGSSYIDAKDISRITRLIFPIIIGATEIIDTGYAQMNASYGRRRGGRYGGYSFAI